MQLAVGNHRFSVMDARRTLAHATDFLDQYPEIVHPYQSARRERIAAEVGDVDPMGVDACDLDAPLETVWRELSAARDDLLASGAAPDSAIGRVEQLSVSGGGVPKQSVDRIEVGYGGVEGDRQATRRHHGSPFQALCLWNTETIAALVADGHPIAPGSAGENVTVSGLDWPSVHPGARLLIGTVLCEISAYAVPCKQNARWFSDGDFNRIHQRNGPLSRVYATVLEPGAIAAGDVVLLEPVSP